ncbi:MAG: SRPBCC family protein [Phyllobacterium sp.]
MMLTKPSLTLVRRINAAPIKVYRAWVDPALMTHWFGPAGAIVLHTEMDPSVGGRFHIVMRTPDGEEHDVSGVYREVIEGERLVFTWAWRSTPERESLVHVTFEPNGDGTTLTLFHEQFYDEAARDGHKGGWTGALERLVAYFD